jgi:hypothetical protein
MRPIADHIFELTKVDMAYCLLIAQDPESLFDNRHLADLIVRCCINSAKEDHWDVIEQLIQLPLFSQISTYQAEVKLVRKFVSAAKLMAKFGYPTTVGRLTALSGDENGQKQLLFRLIRSSLNGRSDKASPPVEVILENIMELRRLVCPRVDKKDIFESFIAQLLASGEQQLHQYAQLLLFPIKEADGLPVSAVDRIIFGSYQDFFDNAASGDMYNGLLKSAVSCLRLIVKQTALPERFSELQRRAQSELEFVEAIHAVCTEFDREKDILPIQIRLEKDKIKFIRQMLQFDPKFYRKKSNLLEILRKLLQINPEVFSGRTKEILVLKCRLLFYLCDAAKNSGDASAALENCNEIISIYSSTLALVADLTSVCCYELASYPDLLGIIERKRLNSIAITVHSEYRPGLGFDDRRISVSMLTLLEQSRQLDKEACINEATEMLLQHLPTHFNGSLDDFITQPTAIKALCTRIPDTTEQIARPRFYQGLSSMAKLDSRKFGPDLSLIDAAADLLLLMRDDALLALLSVKAHLQQDIVEAIADLLCLRKVNDATIWICIIIFYLSKETIESVVVRLADCPENIPPIKAYLGLFCCSWKIAEEARMAKTELVKQSPTSLFEYALQVSKGMPDSIWTRNLRVFEECFKKYEQTELLQVCRFFWLLISYQKHVIDRKYARTKPLMLPNLNRVTIIGNRF